MKNQMMALLAGVAIGATVIQGLYAQGAKPKAYTVGENEIHLRTLHTCLRCGRWYEQPMVALYSPPTDGLLR